MLPHFRLVTVPKQGYESGEVTLEEDSAVLSSASRLPPAKGNGLIVTGAQPLSDPHIPLSDRSSLCRALMAPDHEPPASHHKGFRTNRFHEPYFFKKKNFLSYFCDQLQNTPHLEISPVASMTHLNPVPLPPDTFFSPRLLCSPGQTRTGTSAPRNILAHKTRRGRVAQTLPMVLLMNGKDFSSQVSCSLRCHLLHGDNSWTVGDKEASREAGLRIRRTWE